MRPDSCTPDQIAGMAITRVTLRSIGPYVGSAELPIRPLTVLCGTNGSGKSTWIDVLVKLRALAEDVTCRRLLSDTNPRQDDTTFTRSLNALVHYPNQVLTDKLDSPEAFRIARSKILSSIDSPDATADYGPPGTIGVDCIPLKQIAATESGITQDSLCENPITRLLSTGQLPTGHKISLRWSWPDLILSHDMIEGSELWNWIELRIDNCWKLRLSQPLHNYWVFNPDTIRREKNPECKLVFSMSAGAIENGHPDPTELLCLGTVLLSLGWFQGEVPVRIQADPLPSCPIDAKTLTVLCEQFVRCFRGLLAEATKGIYTVGAIRPRDEKEAPKDISGRRVEAEGSSASQQFAKWANARMGEHISDSARIAPPVYKFNTYVTYWMRRLVGTSINLDCSESYGIWGDESAGPSGSPVALPELPEDDDTPLKTLAESVRPSTLGTGYYGGGWQLMSCGFHQLAPLIVQSGLLRCGDILAIENPEVHLHPDLQIKVAEFLIEQSKAGKCFLIETHSDLIIQRMMRGVLEESIKQEALGIHFTSIDESTGPGLFSARINPISVDRSGRISNWPAGFMDAAMKENQRLLDSVYEAERELGGSEDE